MSVSAPGSVARTPRAIHPGPVAIMKSAGAGCQAGGSVGSGTGCRVSSGRRGMGGRPALASRREGAQMTRPLLNRRLAGMGTTIFAEMSALAVRDRRDQPRPGLPRHRRPGRGRRGGGRRRSAAGRGNQYPPGPGIPELRQAIAAHQQRFYGLDVDPDTEVLVTAGATEAIAAALLALRRTRRRGRRARAVLRLLRRRASRWPARARVPVTLRAAGLPARPRRAARRGHRPAPG